MTNPSITYDKRADVLYITFLDIESIAEEMENGFLLRRVDPFLHPKLKDKIAGITILDFKRWIKNST